MKKYYINTSLRFADADMVKSFEEYIVDCILNCNITPLKCFKTYKEIQYFLDGYNFKYRKNVQLNDEQELFWKINLGG